MKQSKVKQGRLPEFKYRLKELQGVMTNTEFAEFLGMSRQTVGFYLNGDRIPDALGLLDISEKCHVSTDWLIGRSQVKTTDGNVAAVCNFTGLSETSVIKLNECARREDGPNLIAIFFDRLLSGPIFRFRKDVIHCASISIQGGNKYKRPSHEVRSQEPEIGNTFSIMDEVKVRGRKTELSTSDAIRVYRERATRKIEGISPVVIDDYTKKLVEFLAENGNEKCGQ